MLNGSREAIDTLAYPASSAEAAGGASVSSADFSNRLAELQVRPLFVKAYIKKPLAKLERY